MKHCNGCNTTQAVENFGRNSRSADGLEWKCKTCKRAEAKRYIHSEKGKHRRKAWAQENQDRLRQLRKDRIESGRESSDPVKQRARLLVRNAVRKGYIERPQGTKSNPWYQRWEFHHPDHSRPFWGVWLSRSEHEKVEHGHVECPPCVDHAETVKKRVLEEWGL